MLHRPQWWARARHAPDQHLCAWRLPAVLLNMWTFNVFGPAWKGALGACLSDPLCGLGPFGEPACRRSPVPPRRFRLSAPRVPLPVVWPAMRLSFPMRSFASSCASIIFPIFSGSGPVLRGLLISSMQIAEGWSFLLTPGRGASRGPIGGSSLAPTSCADLDPRRPPAPILTAGSLRTFPMVRLRSGCLPCHPMTSRFPTPAPALAPSLRDRTLASRPCSEHERLMVSLGREQTRWPSP